MIQIKNDSFLILCAFRYCLGRRTYMVSACVDWLIDNWDEINCYTKERIQEETDKAIQQELAGDPCDVHEWKKILKLK